MSQIWSPASVTTSTKRKTTKLVQIIDSVKLSSREKEYREREAKKCRMFDFSVQETAVVC